MATLTWNSPSAGQTLTTRSLFISFDLSPFTSMNEAYITGTVSGNGATAGINGSTGSGSTGITWDRSGNTVSTTVLLTGAPNGQYLIELGVIISGASDSASGTRSFVLAMPEVAISAPEAGASVERTMAVQVAYEGFAAGAATLRLGAAGTSTDYAVTLEAASGTISETFVLPAETADGGYTLSATLIQGEVTATRTRAITVVTGTPPAPSTDPWIQVTSPETGATKTQRTVPVALEYGNFVTGSGGLAMAADADVAFDFLGGSGATVQDQSANDHDGTLVGLADGYVVAVSGGTGGNTAYNQNYNPTAALNGKTEYISADGNYAAAYDTTNARWVLMPAGGYPEMDAVAYNNDVDNPWEGTWTGGFTVTQGAAWSRWQTDGLYVSGGGHVELAAGDTVSLGLQDFSIVWIAKAHDPGSGCRWIFADQDSYSGLALARNNASSVYLELSSSSQRNYWQEISLSQDLCPDDVTAACAVTVNRDGLATFYRDGASIGTQDVSAAVSNDMSSMAVLRLFGARSGVDASQSFVGWAQRVWVFVGRVLTAAEVAELHANPQSADPTADHLHVTITPPAGGGDPISVYDEDVAFSASGQISVSGVIPDDDPAQGTYQVEAQCLLDGVAVEGLSATRDFALDVPSTDDTRTVWEAHSPQLGTDADNVPINAESAQFDGVFRRGMFVLDEELDLTDDPAETYNLEAAYNCPGVTTDFGQATPIGDIHHSFAMAPEGSRTVRWFLRATPRQHLSTVAISAAHLVRLGALETDVVALAQTPHQVVRLTPGATAATVLADLSDLATAPTDMAVGDGKVFIASGSRVVVLDTDAGDQRFDLLLGADVTAVTALVWTGAMLVAGVTLSGGGHKLVGWTYPRCRDLATWEHGITALAVLGGTLYAGDDAGQILTVSSAGAAAVAYATTQAAVTRLALQGAVHLAGTSDGGKLYSDLSGWAEAHDFAFGEVRGLAVVDGWLWAGGSGSGELWRQGNAGWASMYSLEGATAVNDMLAMASGDGEELVVAADTASESRIARVRVLPAGEVMVSNEWVAEEARRKYRFEVVETE